MRLRVVLRRGRLAPRAWAISGGAGSAPVITHTAPAPAPLRHSPSSAAAGPSRPPPPGLAYCSRAERDAATASSGAQQGSSSAIRRRAREAQLAHRRAARRAVAQVRADRDDLARSSRCPPASAASDVRVALARLARLDPAEHLQEPRAALGDRAVDLRVRPAEAARRSPGRRALRP